MLFCTCTFFYVGEDEEEDKEMNRLRLEHAEERKRLKEERERIEKEEEEKEHKLNQLALQEKEKHKEEMRKVIRDERAAYCVDSILVIADSSSSCVLAKLHKATQHSTHNWQTTDMCTFQDLPIDIGTSSNNKSMLIFDALMMSENQVERLANIFGLTPFSSSQESVAAMLEYMSAEVLELSGNAARGTGMGGPGGGGGSIIYVKHLRKAITEDVMYTM